MTNGQMLLTERTRNVLQAVFPPDRWRGVEEALVHECGPKQVHSPDFGADAMERVWLAVLKKSGGDTAGLETSVLLATTDWRDLLAGAGFEDDVTAHVRWAQQIILGT